MNGTTLARAALFFAAALALASSSPAQTNKPRNTTVVVDLRASYDLWPSDAKLSIGDVFTLAEGKAKYQDLWRAFQDPNWKDKRTDAQLLRFTLFEAAHWDALLRNAPLLVVGNDLPHGVLIGSRNWITWPPGEYLVTFPIEYAAGVIEGCGTGVGNLEYGGTGGATEIRAWHDRWVGDPKHRVVMRSAHHGSDNVYAYGEGVEIRRFRINGDAGAWHDPNKAVTGLQAWDLGEASDVTALFVYNCDTGINIVRGTPFTSSGCISVFSNNCAGIALTGGGTINLATLSGDDNGRLVHSRPGYGRPASCRLNIGAVKAEWGITPKEYKRTWKPNGWELEGWSRVNIGVYSHATGNVYQDALFVMKPDVNTSHVKVSDFTLWGASNLDLLLRDRVNKEAWDFDNGWLSGVQEFRWSSVDGGTLESWPRQAPRLDYAFTGPQLGYLEGDPNTGAPVGSFDRVNGKPSWSDVTGSSAAPVTPPASCVYTYSAWGPCVNGTRTRSVTSATPVGCTGTPILSEPCTSAPAAIVWSSTFSGSNVNTLVATKGSNITAAATWSGLAKAPNGTATAQGNTSFGWTGGAVVRVELLGLTLTAAPNWTALTASHIVYPDGRVFYRANGSDTFTGVTVSQGTRYERLALPCPGGTLAGVLGGPVGTGSTQAFTLEALEVYR